MPGIDHPQGRWPKKVLFTNSTFSWINCHESVAVNTVIQDWDEANQLYVQTPNGVYQLSGSSNQITVLDGVITSIDPV